ncbi:MAG: hypothetical protein ACFFCP_01425 [Promethearchaeota archaeon]
MNLRTARFVTAMILIACMLVAAFSVHPVNAQTESWTISGVVRDEIANPIPDVLVAALGPAGVQVASTVTDLAGAYSMVVPGGTYDIAVTPPPESGLASRTIYGFDVSSDVILDIVLTPAIFVTFSGQVVDRIGRPVPHQQMYLDTPSESFSSDQDGYFSVQVPYGQHYGLHLDNYQGDDITREQIPSHYYIDMFSLDLSQDTEMTIVLENRYLTGIVIDPNGDPVPDATIDIPWSVTSFGGFDGYFSSSTTSDANGEFNLTVFPSIVDYLTVIPPEGSPWGEAFIYGLDVTTDTSIIIQLSQFVTFNGQIIDRTGRPVPHQQMYFSNSLSFSSDQDGYFSIQVPAGQNYGLHLDNYQSDDITREQIPSHYHLDMFSLDLSQDTEMTIVLENRYLTGIVIDPNGDPVPDATIDIPWSVTSFGGFGGDFSSSTTSDANGEFNLTVFSSIVDTLIAIPPGGSPWGRVSIHGLDVTMDTSIIIQLAQMVTFSGQVVDRIGRPVPHQQMYLDTPSESFSSDQDGYFSIQVPAGQNYGIHMNNYQGDDITREQIPSLYYLDMFGLDLSQDTDMTITLENLFLTGMVIDTSGNPIPDVTIYIPWAVTEFGGFSGWYRSSTISDANGEFNFTVFPSIIDYLTATPPEGSPYASVAVDSYVMFEDQNLIIILTSPVEPINSIIDFDPDTLNLQSEGSWVTVYIEFTPGESHDISDINLNSISLNGLISADSHWFEIGDYDLDGNPDLMVKFNRSLVQELLEVGESVTITINGLLMDGTPFGGTDTIRVISEPLWKTIEAVPQISSSMTHLVVSKKIEGLQNPLS